MKSGSGSSGLLQCHLTFPALIVKVSLGLLFVLWTVSRCNDKNQIMERTFIPTGKIKITKQTLKEILPQSLDKLHPAVA